MRDPKASQIEVNFSPFDDDIESLTQAERFRRVAMELGADEDEAAFKAKLAQIARAVPKDEPVKPKKGNDRE